MANIIKIDTERLNSTISGMESDLDQINNLIAQIYQEMKQLDTMWDGPANDMFNVQFEKDNQEFLRICGKVKDYIGKLDYAKNEYNKCENKVNEIVRSIRI